MSDVKWLNATEERAWRTLQFMQLHVDGELARRLAAESNLSYPDYIVLVALTDQPDGRIRLFELGCELGWEKSRLSHHIARMVKRGLVAKEKCPTDRRGSFVVVTDHGRAEIASAAPSHLAAVRDLFIDHLSSQQLEAITDVAETVLAATNPNSKVRPR